MKSSIITILVAFTAFLALNLFFYAESDKPEVLPKDSVRTVVDTIVIRDTVLLLKQAVPCTTYIVIDSTRVIEDITARFDTTLEYSSGCTDSISVSYSLLNNVFRMQNKHIGKTIIEKETIYSNKVDFVSLWGVFCISKSNIYEGDLGIDALFNEKYMVGLRVSTDKSIGINTGIRFK